MKMDMYPQYIHENPKGSRLDPRDHSWRIIITIVLFLATASWNEKLDEAILVVALLGTAYFISLFIYTFIRGVQVVTIEPDSKLTKPPGTKLMKMARFCYSAKTIEEVFEPTYADFYEEYFAALAAGHKWKARWIRVRYYKDFAQAVAMFGVVRLAKTVFEYWEKIA